MNARGDDFFEETIRIGRIFDLLNTRQDPRRVRAAGRGDTEAQIDATVDELIDWMVEQDLRIWKSVTDYIDRRRLPQYEEELIGEVGGQFRYDRRALLESVAPSAPRRRSSATTRAEAHDLSDSVRNAVATVAVAEAGAVGLGALVVAAASTVAVDVTGILAASLLAGLGLFILPRKRKTARDEFRPRSENSEERLIEVMSEQFEHELARSVGRIQDAIAPYTRFVKTEQERVSRAQDQLNEVRNALRTLRHRIGPDTDTSAASLPPEGARSSAPVPNRAEAIDATNAENGTQAARLDEV